jgi:hypothetical protein
LEVVDEQRPRACPSLDKGGHGRFVTGQRLPERPAQGEVRGVGQRREPSAFEQLDPGPRGGRPDEARLADPGLAHDGDRPVGHQRRCELVDLGIAPDDRAGMRLHRRMVRGSTSAINAILQAARSGPLQERSLSRCSQPSRWARTMASVVRRAPSARRPRASRRSAVRRERPSSAAASPRE